eukprot:m.71225 g.71225  ORF g.71225 m.71225 type:complete len:327 (-) comp7925_c0_seq2:37-1017(-)
MATTAPYLCSVEGKLPCVFETAVLPQASAKRGGQAYSVVATSQLRSDFLECVRAGHVTATEKLDGTCSVVDLDPESGVPRLWARLDRKPSKAASRAFREFEKQQRTLASSDPQSSDADKVSTSSSNEFPWDEALHFAEAPAGWRPAKEVKRNHATNSLQPTPNGHLPGWMPVTAENTSYKWHLSALSLETDSILVLEIGKQEGEVRLEWHPLADHVEQTFELVGPKVNKAYDLNFHFFVQHGKIPLNLTLDDLTFDHLREWILRPANYCEGVVFHCIRPSGEKALFKVHQHHLGLDGWACDCSRPRFSSWMRFVTRPDPPAPPSMP